jgi:putative transposase
VSNTTTGTQIEAMPETLNTLEGFVREGARRMLQAALDAKKQRVRRPRVDDRALEEMGKERFTSRILPRFIRRAPSIDALVPLLYLKGISMDDFPEALEAILGPQAKGLSATTVVRLKEIWASEHGEWSRCKLADKSYVYVCADGVYCNARLWDERSCLLVVMGADSFGNKESLAVSDGFRKSAQSWKELFLDLRSHG